MQKGTFVFDAEIKRTVPWVEQPSLQEARREPAAKHPDAEAASPRWLLVHSVPTSPFEKSVLLSTNTNRLISSFRRQLKYKTLVLFVWCGAQKHHFYAHGFVRQQATQRKLEEL